MKIRLGNITLLVLLTWLRLLQIQCYMEMTHIIPKENARGLEGSMKFIRAFQCKVTLLTC
ncbi:hypothetical protein PGTUg99_036393 [Puccinia graminis f. sp. tritici]|uniref:Uncharacterized protein n=1 Tax=Puccinia graminis f. sp. tritici TaxID=56615 RepID=A0A5B0PQA0_PUCGR|nr:hypothetical protein PGTUg99_036393 [Puccinia graminis f. sp. tritici]